MHKKRCVVNNLYDLLGFVAPITMQGKTLVRELLTEEREWDASLFPQKETELTLRKVTLRVLEDLHIQRCYLPVLLSSTQRKQLCIFSKASTVAIGAVAYLRAAVIEEHNHVAFVMGNPKLAPRPVQHHMELCAVVLAVELHELIRDELDVEGHTVKFFTDSKVTYIIPQEDFICMFPTG